ncbi:tRNA (guanosine(37)-N1)-methyltransferase TrmD [Phototrophicus methaneseepsis]|uniref:tRNA (guanine-N(1)-)-methyltransferase n=1 Tax=Phototrophicus methaneseepsis TaxID=2710758 RepID=A0A7S8EDS0_9CHLR|nr:tRNA (guanosine(37)-N1)-methyltransferase TrmD [Phototrophicus methaneseepsis]
MRVDILTLFPGMFAPMHESMMWKAQDRGLLDFHTHDIRDWTTDRHRTVDDTPYGGGGGMVLKADILVPAIEATRGETNAPVILMSPQGRVFKHEIAHELAQHEHLVIVCGHYEGFDERIRALVATDEISIGDYVLTSGELAAMVVVDAVVRLLPGVLGAETGAETDSHADGLLEGPHYTRPAEFRGLGVPDVLKSGNHGAVDAWRREQALRRTWEKRPDLLERAPITDKERALLARWELERTFDTQIAPDGDDDAT